MTVHFIGAGPGNPDLITVRGLKLIRSCGVVIYAGSLVPREVLAEVRENAVVIDSAPMHLDAIVAEIQTAHGKGEDVARLHSGDPSLYGATAEQMRRLDALGIDYDVCPGVPAYAAAAAALKRELTLPDVGQTVILTRTATRSSKMPNGEDLPTLARSGATLAIHLGIANLANVVRDLTPFYGDDCPVVVAFRVGWPDERFIEGTLGVIRDRVKKAGLTRTALILVGPVLGRAAFTDSKLYDAEYQHVLRPRVS